jgi:hypothetical protein
MIQDSKFRGGSHHVAPEAMSGLKAHAEAKFHMYYIGLRK